jgi:hypothetical protein
MLSKKIKFVHKFKLILSFYFFINLKYSLYYR